MLLTTVFLAFSDIKKVRKLQKFLQRSFQGFVSRKLTITGDSFFARKYEHFEGMNCLLIKYVTAVGRLSLSTLKLQPLFLS